MQNSCWKACSKTKHQKKSQSVLCPMMLCNILTRILNSSIHAIFRENCSSKLIYAQCNLSKCTPKVVSLPTLKKYKLMSHTLSNISCQMEWCLLHKEVIIAFKILISKCPMVYSGVLRHGRSGQDLANY